MGKEPRKGRSKMKTVTDKQIREYVGRREGVERVKITRGGEVHCYGSMSRGDGGNPYWWMFVGMKQELVTEMEAARTYGMEK